MNGGDAVGVIGYLAVVVFASTGAYIWLRWGFCGVAVIWSNRVTIDEMVQDQARETIRKP